MSLRTPQTQAKYDAFKMSDMLSLPCFLCVKEDVSYGAWKLVKNKFPYDLIALPETHFLFCPQRHVAEEIELNEHEISERERIIRHLLSTTFSCMMLNFGPARTHKTHLHYHVWVNKS